MVLPLLKHKLLKANKTYIKSMMNGKIILYYFFGACMKFMEQPKLQLITI